eukprot:1313578-Rhodomonas_salina.1
MACQTGSHRLQPERICGPSACVARATQRAMCGTCHRSRLCEASPLSNLNPHFSLLSPQLSILYPLPSTLYPLPSTLNPQPGNLNAVRGETCCLSSWQPRTPDSLYPQRSRSAQLVSSHMLLPDTALLQPCVRACV